MPNYEDILLIKVTRTREDKQCNWYINITARYVGHQTLVKGRGYKRKLTSDIIEDNGLLVAAGIRKVPSKSCSGKCCKLYNNVIIHKYFL